jgi:glutamyl-Q tRNA(Asp) synthetase
MSAGGYVGRFAPSPTGRLHMGSLLSAVASFCDARHHGGRWLVRMEDLDPPREVAGAADDILRTLEAFGLHWDGEVLYQSDRDEAYIEALEKLVRMGRAYGCACTRKELEGHSVYPGNCSRGIVGGRPARSVRFRIGGGAWSWFDAVQGQQRFDSGDIGDYVVRRADGLWAYQLAVVVDDLDQGITHVVRGADLLDSTPKQMALREVLSSGSQTMCWAHAPMLVNAGGQKLSKQTFAAPVRPSKAPELILRALEMLGQSMPTEESRTDWVANGDVAAVLDRAVAQWNLDAVSASAIHWQGEGHP